MLTLTACSKDEFTCSEGSCVTMDKRCDGKEDCQDYSDESGCRPIQTFDGYDMFRVPHPIGNQTKLILNLSIAIDKILNIDENHGYFKIKMRIVRTWFNPHLKFINLKRKAVKNLMSTDDIEIMWMPWTVFHNIEHENEVKKAGIIEIVRIIPSPGFKFTRSDKTNIQNTRIFEGSESTIYYENEISVNWLCDFNMAWYPFDSQVCSLQMFQNEVPIALNPVSVAYFGTKQLPQHSYKFVAMCSHNVSNKPGVIVEVHLGRPLLGSILTIFLPTGVLIILSQMVGVFHGDYLDMVIGVNLTLLLVLATL